MYELNMGIVTVEQFRDFTVPLIKKLKSLDEEEKLFEKGTTKYTAIAHAVLSHLHRQMMTGRLPKPNGDIKEVGKLISTVEEFLAMFNKG